MGPVLCARAPLILRGKPGNEATCTYVYICFFVVTAHVAITTHLMTPSSFLRSRNGKGFLLLFLIVGVGLVIYFRWVWCVRRGVAVYFRWVWCVCRGSGRIFQVGLVCL